MADPNSFSLTSIPLSSPVLLNLYTLCVVAITAVLAVWGPKVISAALDSAREAVTSKTDSEADTSKTGEEEKEKEKEQDDKKEDETDKKWKRKNQIWWVVYAPHARRTTY
jgi:hypothetical protein